MTTRLIHVAVVILMASAAARSAAGQPVITEVSPLSGQTAGGTAVTITGMNFEVIDYGNGVIFRPEVYFGAVRARSETLVSSSTLIASTPAHVKGLVDVTVVQAGTFTSTLKNAFSYVGSDADAIRRFLIPILLPPIPGTYGSEFRSELWISNPSDRWPATLEGLVEPSGAICSACTPEPLTVRGGAPVRAFPSGAPGTFVDVAADPAETLAMNLRVYDTSRASTNFGTEIPNVPVNAFRPTVNLTGVPSDPRFRLMLRVYGTGPSNSVRMTFGGVSQVVALRNARNRFDPYYAELPLALTANAGTQPLILTVESLPAVPDAASSPIWAFITVTNNESQHITTITPQPTR